MSRRKSSSAKPSLSAIIRQWWRACLLLVFVALVVARPLLPSEGVSWMGDGQPFNLAWMVLAAAYFAGALFEGRLRRPLDLADGAMAALVALNIASDLLGADFGAPRFSINMLFEWIALGLVFFLARQLIGAARESRLLVAAMLALAVVFSAQGFYQVFVSLPADREAYAENPDEVLRSLGQWYPPGSPERASFEHRLDSTEPLATFALTNSLAGFLAPWLIVMIGICISQFESRRAQIWQLASLILCALGVTACLVLTKSRSAYVAFAIGLMLLPLTSAGFRRALNWKLVGAGAIALALVVGGALAFKGLDTQVLTEASKSLGYRLEYWEATLMMIGDHPWFGIGAGNFQDYYTLYKLPQSSEEVRDPHNLFLEVWAAGGTFALVALLELVALCGWRTITHQFTPQAPLPGAKAPLVHANSLTLSDRLMVLGVPAGFLAAFVIGPFVGWPFGEEKLVAGLAIAAAVLALLWTWIRDGEMPPRLPALAALVLLVHLLASGGIEFSGVAYSFWILIALALGETEREPIASPVRATLAQRLVPLSGLVVSLAAAGCCYYFACGPVVRLNAAMAEVSRARELAPGSPITGLLLLEAAKADPLSAEPWMAMGEYELARIKQRPGELNKEKLDNAAERMLELRPHSSSAWRTAGTWYSRYNQLSPNAENAKAVAEFYKQAALLYPNSATARAEYALAAFGAGEPATARQQAERAIELDDITPHADKKIPPELKARLEDAMSKTSGRETPERPAGEN